MQDSAPALIAPAFGKLLRDFMTDEATQPGEERGSIHDRVQALREKASDLSQTLDRVEETLREAERESNE
ncbi:MAG TPA: hypothetical protein VEX43_18045 [Chthoniobacterales bacterium]|nr:hypothetical protein [Chthoniobacterales bacterium]